MFLLTIEKYPHAEMGHRLSSAQGVKFQFPMTLVVTAFFVIDMLLYNTQGTFYKNTQGNPWRNYRPAINVAYTLLMGMSPISLATVIRLLGWEWLIPLYIAALASNFKMRCKVFTVANLPVCLEYE